MEFALLGLYRVKNLFVTNFIMGLILYNLSYPGDPRRAA